jgi:nicotinamidase-related amidase
METVSIIDRTDFFARMNEALTIDFSKTAMIQIDMHKRQIDAEWSGFPQKVADKILPNAGQFLDDCRELGLPVIHVMVYTRPVEKNMFPRGVAVQKTGIFGTAYGPPKKAPYTTGTAEGEFEWDVMPILGPKGDDYVINTKKQLTSSFLSTDLEHLIRSLGVDTFFVVGINTNNCVSNFSFDAANRGWTPILVRECVGSVHGQDLHEFALLNIARTLGFAMMPEEALDKIRVAKGVAEATTFDIAV